MVFQCMNIPRWIVLVKLLNHRRTFLSHLAKSTSYTLHLNLPTPAAEQLWHGCSKSHFCFLCLHRRHAFFLFWTVCVESTGLGILFVSATRWARYTYCKNKACLIPRSGRFIHLQGALCSTPIYSIATRSSDCNCASGCDKQFNDTIQESWFESGV